MFDYLLPLICVKTVKNNSEVNLNTCYAIWNQ